MKKNILIPAALLIGSLIFLGLKVNAIHSSLDRIFYRKRHMLARSDTSVSDVTIITSSDFEEWIRSKNISRDVLDDYATANEMLNAMMKELALIREARERGLPENKDSLLLIDALKASVMRDFKANVTENDIRMYYDSHRDLFNRKPQYRLLHIAVSDSRKLEGLIFSLNSMLERTANADEAMISLANDFSRNDPLRKQWGDLGWVSEEQFPREFSRKVFLKDNPGKYAVFQFSCAYHLVMITGMREAKVSSLDEVRNYIKSKLIKERKREFWDSFIRKVFKKQNLKIYSFNLKEIIPESKRKGIVFPRGGYFP